MSDEILTVSNALELKQSNTPPIKEPIKSKEPSKSKVINFSIPPVTTRLINKRSVSVFSKDNLITAIPVTLDQRDIQFDEVTNMSIVVEDFSYDTLFGSTTYNIN